MVYFRGIFCGEVREEEKEKHFSVIFGGLELFSFPFFLVAAV